MFYTFDLMNFIFEFHVVFSLSLRSIRSQNDLNAILRLILKNGENRSIIFQNLYFGQKLDLIR